MSLPPSSQKTCMSQIQTFQYLSSWNLSVKTWLDYSKINYSACSLRNGLEISKNCKKKSKSRLAYLVESFTFLSFSRESGYNNFEKHYSFNGLFTFSKWVRRYF